MYRFRVRNAHRTHFIRFTTDIERGAEMARKIRFSHSERAHSPTLYSISDFPTFRRNNPTEERRRSSPNSRGMLPIDNGVKW